MVTTLMEYAILQSKMLHAKSMLEQVMIIKEGEEPTKTQARLRVKQIIYWQGRIKHLTNTLESLGEGPIWIIEGICEGKTIKKVFVNVDQQVAEQLFIDRYKFFGIVSCKAFTV